MEASRSVLGTLTWAQDLGRRHTFCHGAAEVEPTSPDDASRHLKLLRPDRISRLQSSNSSISTLSRTASPASARCGSSTVWSRSSAPGWAWRPSPTPSGARPPLRRPQDLLHQQDALRRSAAASSSSHKTLVTRRPLPRHLGPDQPSGSAGLKIPHGE